MFSGLMLLITILAGAVAYFGANFNQVRLGLGAIPCKIDRSIDKKLFPIDKAWLNDSGITNILQLNDTGRISVTY